MSLHSMEESISLPTKQVLSSKNSRSFTIEPSHILKHTYAISSVACSPDEKYVLIVSGNKAYLREVASGELVHTFEGDTDRIRAVAYATGGDYVLTGFEEKTVDLFRNYENMLY